MEFVHPTSKWILKSFDPSSHLLQLPLLQNIQSLQAITVGQFKTNGHRYITAVRKKKPITVGF